ncbi:MAG: hypothetical protein K2F99_09545 [Muribaculaceae bacterium]|nr:hypothetical protein [Muribaculaceae bacterium]
MEFKILLTADRPTDGDLVLEAETPLSGVEFIAEMGRCLRRSIDHLVRTRHVTLGALSCYEITVPQCMAIESGLFETKNTISVIVENNLLSNYIFYGGTVSTKSTGRPCYPYMHGEAVLNSFIDELQFLEDWANLGYPTRLAWDNGLVVQTYAAPTTNVHIGCHGCTSHREPPPPPPHYAHHNHPHHCEPECDICPPDLGHNKPIDEEEEEHVCDWCGSDTCCGTGYPPREPNHKLPHSNVRPGNQNRPGPKPPPHHGHGSKPPRKPSKKMGNHGFTFVC